MASHLNTKQDGLWANIFAKKETSNTDVIDVLKNSPLFSTLNKSELKEFETITHLRHYQAKDVIFWEGEPGVGMYVIKSGEISVWDIKNEEKNKIAQLIEGDFFGELALLDEIPRSATCIADTTCEVIGLFQPDLFSLLSKKPSLGNKFLFQLASVIGERLVEKNKECAELRKRLTAEE